MTFRSLAFLVIAMGCIAQPEEPKPPHPLDGIYQAARYNPNVMQRVARIRGIPMGECGMSFDGPPLGTLVRVEGVRTGVGRVCAVIDVSETRDLKRHLKARQVELDHASALAICSRRFYKSRPKECPVRVTIVRMSDGR